MENYKLTEKYLQDIGSVAKRINENGETTYLHYHDSYENFHRVKCYNNWESLTSYILILIENQNSNTLSISPKT